MLNRAAICCITPWMENKIKERKKQEQKEVIVVKTKRIKNCYILLMARSDFDMLSNDQLLYIHRYIWSTNTYTNTQLNSKTL